MQRYLIVVCGYEGFEDIVGLFSKEEAIQKMNELRKNPVDEYTKPEQYCVMYVDNKGAECVCSKLGFGLKKPWLH